MQSSRYTSHPCPLCQSQKIAIFRAAKGSGQLAADALGSSRTHITHPNLLRCSDCGFVFSELRPADEDLHTLYREMDPALYEKESQGRQRTAQRHLKIVKRYLSRGKLLDAGCASGSFLAVAAADGWTVSGVEPSSVLCAKAKKLLAGRGDVHCTTLQDSGLPQAAFDALTLWDVLEHVTDPQGFLSQCADMVRPGGFVFANVPDIQSRQARLLGERWPLLLAEHLNYFDRDTLARCGARAGLKAVGFDRRPASFSLEYILHRVAQHRIPGGRLGHRLAEGNALGQISLPVYLGEVLVIWEKA